MPLAAAVEAAAQNMVLIAAGNRLGFRHALTRELVLAALPAPVRSALCRSAAAVLEACPERDAISGRLDELWAHAGDPRRAAEAFRRAAHRARIAGATSTAESMLGSALASAPPELLGPLRRELLELLAGAWRIRQLSTLGVQALDDLAHDSDLTAAVRLLLAMAAVAAGTPTEAQPHLGAVTAAAGLSARRVAQLRIVQGAVVMAGASVDRLAVTGHLAGQAVALAKAGR